MEISKLSFLFICWKKLVILFYLYICMYRCINININTYACILPLPLEKEGRVTTMCRELAELKEIGYSSFFEDNQEGVF